MSRWRSWTSLTLLFAACDQAGEIPAQSGPDDPIEVVSATPSITSPKPTNTADPPDDGETTPDPADEPSEEPAEEPPDPSGGDPGDDLAPPQDDGPSCEITEPIDGDMFDEDTPILFAAQSDVEGLVLVWSAQSAGMMVIGNAFDYILPPGDHVVTVQGQDRQGARCTDDVHVSVAER